MHKLKIGDTITLNNENYLVVPVPVKVFNKTQGYNCAHCDMVIYTGKHLQCNMMVKNNEFYCRKHMPFGTQFRKIGKGGI